MQETHKNAFMQNLHSRPKNPFKALLLDLERAYALPCGFHYYTPGAAPDPAAHADCARSARSSEQPEPED